MEIFLIRHTKPSVSHEICYGWTDLTLADSFDEEWLEVSSKLPVSFDAIYSSPLKRCRILAENLNGSQIHFDDRLRELNFGEWEMKAWNDISPDGLKVWMDHFVDKKAPGGESFRDLHARVTNFIGELEQKSFQKVAIVTHAGVIRTLVSHMLGMPLENAFRMHLDYGGVSLIAYKDKIHRVMFLNK